jgi:hypothetical protein
MFTFLRGIESPLERCGLQRRTPDATKAHHLLCELLPRKTDFQGQLQERNIGDKREIMVKKIKE